MIIKFHLLPEPVTDDNDDDERQSVAVFFRTVLNNLIISLSK
jgi:hypothetical protein